MKKLLFLLIAFLPLLVYAQNIVPTKEVVIFPGDSAAIYNKMAQTFDGGKAIIWYNGTSNKIRFCWLGECHTISSDTHLGNSNLTLTSDRTVTGAGNDLIFDDTGLFSVTPANGSAINFETDNANMFFTALGGDLEMATTGLYTASGGGGILFTASGTSDITFSANDDIRLNATDDLQLNNVSGISGQVISNTNGHAAWVDANTLVVDNIYNNDGSIDENRALSGAGLYSIAFNSLTAFDIASTGLITITGSGASITTSGNQTLDAGVTVFIHGDDDVVVDADDDFDLTVGDNFTIDGIAGSTNQVISNIDGHPVWVTLSSGGSGDPTAALLEVQTTTVGNITTGEDVLWSYSLPADTLSVDGQFIRGHISGQVANNTNSKIFKLKFGATTFLTRTTLEPVAGQGYTIDWEIIRTSATTQKLNASFKGSDGIVSAFYATASETLSGAVTIQLTGEATATDDIQKQTAVTTWGFGSFGTDGGGSGDVSLADLVTGETPSGTIDGINDEFTLAFTPTGYVHIYLDGLLQDEGDDYTRTGPNITFIIPPIVGSKIRASYIK